ncbi:Ldh family oxidoreductase [Micromonospora sp. NPDC050187]|uniref:Ldh family oxidoreductase n=1 Tax=Micromonospora sp. NPDC050187 TaxID=3364277 RepID=UPI003789E566
MAERNAGRCWTPGQARTVTRTALAARGVPPGPAGDVADALVDAEMAAHPSHGLRLLPGYLDDLAEGRLDAAAVPELRRDGSHVVARGSRVLGPHLVRTALAVAGRAAREYGCATAVLPDVAHCGRLGGYVDRLARNGQIAMLTVGSLGSPEAFVSPFGGRHRWLDTNPVAFGFPAQGPPVVVDLATSATTYNAVVAAREAGRPLPAGVACAADGTGTTDPAAVLDGGWVRPAADAKGYALGLVAPLLAALAAGPDADRLSGGFALVVDVANRTDLDGYRRAVEASLRRLTADADPAGAVRVPGRADPAPTTVAVTASLVAELRRRGCEIP